MRGPIRPLKPETESARDPFEHAPAQQAPGYEEAPWTPGPAPLPAPPKRTGRRIALWVGVLLLTFLLLVIGWGLAGYFSLKGGVQDANARLPEEAQAALSDQEGSLLSSPSTILLLGVDTGLARRGDGGRADSIVLLRTDPDNHRISLLSIPRDLRVPISGFDDGKINAAYAYGGAALTIQTVENLTGLPINHVVIVDFTSFAKLIDAIGGVTVNVPKRILSNRFDCPYGTKARCERWQGWQFNPGKQTLDGRRALIYSRIRENRLDASETDIARGARQQEVVQALTDKIVSPGGFLHLPFTGGDLARPVATDMTTGELARLGWVKFRASDEASLHCRLGGTPDVIDGVWYLTGSEENSAVISMFLGRSAPQPPPPYEGLFAPGCL